MLNPVEQRLLELASHWDNFRSDTSKRLLIWLANDNALRFYHCFFEVQKHETEYTVGDLFIVFDAPFDNAIEYSRSLKQALIGQYEASREDLKEQGITPDWELDSSTIADSATGFVTSLRSLGSKHHKSIGHLVAVLMPSEVADEAAFAGWLTRALAAGVPERLRLVVVDLADRPRLASLIGSNHQLIAIDRPNIDALTTAQETFAQEGGVGPAAVFRNYLIGLMTLVEKDSAEQVRTKAVDALKFARQQQWPDQEVVVRMLVAGSLLKEKQFEEAARHYSAARKVAHQAVEAGHPAGQQLVLQTWFGEGGVYLAAGEFEKAIECYDEAAVLAQGIPHQILGIEAFRMGLFCAARMDKPDLAIDRGLKALALGERLKPDARNMTTLPIAGIDLLRVLDPERVKRMEQVKSQQDRQIAEARTRADRQAVDLESSTNPQALQAVEADFEQCRLQAEQSAAEAIDRLVPSDNEQFQQVFARGRDLLGTSWPLAKLFPAPAESDAAGGDGP